MQGENPFSERDFLMNIRTRCATFVEMGASLIDNIDGRLAYLSALPPVTAVEPQAPAVSGLWTSGQDRKRLIRECVRGFGPSPIKVVADALGTSYQSIFNLVSKGQYSMVADGSITIGNERPALLHLNEEYEETERTRVYPYITMIERAVREEHKHELVLPIRDDFAKTVCIYTEEVIWPRNHGERRQAGRIRKALSNNGLIGAIAVIATGRVRSGLHALHALGHGDLTAEALVLKYPDLFEADIIAKAQARIDEGASDTEVDEGDDAE